MAKMKTPAATLYMVIDVTTPETTKLLRITDLRRAALYGHLFKHQGLKVIAPVIEGRGFSKLPQLNLQYLYWNICQETPPDDYGQLVQKCLEKLAGMTQDESTFESLMKEINRLGINLDDPTMPAEKKEPAEKDPNAIPARPAVRSTTGLVWELADIEFGKAGNQMPERKAVIDACIAEEINPATESTQYAKWAKAKRAEIGI